MQLQTFRHRQLTIHMHSMIPQRLHRFGRWFCSRAIILFV